MRILFHGEKQMITQIGLEVCLILTIYNNTSDSLKTINLSTEVYLNDVAAYGIGYDNSEDSFSSTFWDYDGINYILTFDDINFDGTIYLKSFGSEEIEIDDINLNSDYFNLDADDGTLSSGESITLQLDFNHQMMVYLLIQY